MSNFFGLIKHGPKAGKYVMETLVPKISKNLKQKFEAKQKLFKGVDEKGSGLTTAEKGKFKKEGSQKIDKVFEKYEKKAKGGRIGYKRGSGRKSNIEKIKKTFGPNKKLGMQSIIYGLDKNPNVTAADPKAKFIAAANKKKKKKVI
jgi:hypothetical protein